VLRFEAWNPQWLTNGNYSRELRRRPSARICRIEEKPFVTLEHYRISHQCDACDETAPPVIRDWGLLPFVNPLRGSFSEWEVGTPTFSTASARASIVIRIGMMMEHAALPAAEAATTATIQMTPLPTESRWKFRRKNLDDQESWEDSEDK